MIQSMLRRMVPTARWRATAVLATPLLVLLAQGSPARGAQPEVDYMATLVARSFFRGLLGPDPAATLPLCADRLNLDGDWVQGEAAIKARLVQMGKRARQHGIRLQRVLVIPYREAVKRFGPPPERLKGCVGPGRLVALARFNAMGAVAILTKRGGYWKVAGITD